MYSMNRSVWPVPWKWRASSRSKLVQSTTTTFAGREPAAAARRFPEHTVDREIDVVREDLVVSESRLTNHR